MRATNHFGGLDVASGCHRRDLVPLLGAIGGCPCSVPWLGRVTANFGGVDVVPLQGAIVAGGYGDQLWGSGRGAIAGCHCRGAFSSTLITPKLFFAIWGLCWYNFFRVF